MKIIKKFFYTLLFVIVFLILMQISTQARSYSIEEMNIQATVLDNGDVNIKQSITYDFNDVYNGIYINIPYVIEDKEIAWESEVEGNISKVYVHWLVK